MGDVFSWIVANWDNLLIAINGLVAALIAVSLLIPGEQPEKFLRGVASFLEKFSRK